ncbi:AMP-binding protein [Microbacterium sp. NIBRBAC000506063]|uniref:AMP-binding protein n=1 Tax=Microbacterium sp. NIBRBAC000506063 TaxID=2734618 RepID=UPI0021D41A43|nr:AMP-binding protein [Microbacterium sp. NIBRBAC000506063]
MSLPANIRPLSPLAFLERAASVFPEREAIRNEGDSLSYAEFATQAQYAARAIAARIEPGDRIAVLAPNVPELLIAHFAVPLAGAALVAINTRLSASEITSILEHSGARMLFVDPEYREVAAAAVIELETGPEIIALGEAWAGSGSYASLLDEGSGLPARPWVIDDENAVISINYTSGTTGRPKGVMYSHRGAALTSLGLLAHTGFDSATRYLWTLPMFHCNGWCTAWAVTAAAGLHVCLRAVREEAVWRAIDEVGVTHLCGAPTVLSVIADAPQSHPLDQPLTMITGGAPPSPTIIARLESIGVKVTHAYGLTEVYGPYTLCEYQESWSALPAAQRAERMARQGVPMIQSGEVRVVDAEMADVPADGESLGEIVMRGNNVMLGYFGDPEATRTAFEGGWFHSGDIGVMHPDGYIELRDRAKDLIISGGENISSIEVENALLAHPEILDAAVVAAPHPHWGERPVAFIVTQSRTGPLPRRYAPSSVNGWRTTRCRTGSRR